MRGAFPWAPTGAGMRPRASLLPHPSLFKACLCCCDPGSVRAPKRPLGRLLRRDWEGPVLRRCARCAWLPCAPRSTGSPAISRFVRPRVSSAMTWSSRRASPPGRAHGRQRAWVTVPDRVRRTSSSCCAWITRIVVGNGRDRAVVRMRSLSKTPSAPGRCSRPPLTDTNGAPGESGTVMAQTPSSGSDGWSPVSLCRRPSTTAAGSLRC